MLTGFKKWYLFSLQKHAVYRPPSGAVICLCAALVCCINSSFASDVPRHMTDTHNQWEDYIQGLLPLGEQARAQLTDSDNALLEQELYRHMYLILSQGFGALVYQDSEHPDFWPQFSTMYNYAISNVDDTYYMTPIKPEGVYKVTGYRGTAHSVDFQIGSEHFFYTGLGKLGPPLNNFDLDQDIEIDVDGTFEFILSASRPKGYEGNWLPLDPRATHLLVRQVFYDWENEVTGRYSIERLDIPAAKPRQSRKKISAQLQKISESTANWINFVLAHTRNLRERDMINRMSVRDFSQAGGISSQMYMDGLYDIQEDEALILEVDIPEDCFYWSYVIYDELWHVVDWLNRQCSINGHSAHINSDGKFRAVVSARDPGVPNWLDNAGYQRGGLFGRFNRCPGELKPAMKRVAFDALRQHLPADTPIVSAQERDERVRARRRAIQLRRRW